MKIHFKKTIWEEIIVPLGKEEYALNVLKSQTATSANDTFLNHDNWNWENIIGSDEILNHYENGGCPTISVFNDNMKTIWDNGQKEPK